MKKSLFFILFALMYACVSAQDPESRDKSRYTVNDFEIDDLYMACQTHEPVSVKEPGGRKVKNIIFMIGAGTALATGSKTRNGALAVSVHDEPMETLSEYARSKGKKTGTSVVCRICDAAPAAFSYAAAALSDYPSGWESSYMKFFKERIK